MKIRQDDNCSVLTPKGKVLQVDYACESSKNGSPCLAIKSKDAVILCALKNNPSKLATYQEKIFKISNKCNVVISGLTADARVICKYLRNESLNFKHTFGEDSSASFLLSKISTVAQEKTYIRGKRPFGVGLLFAGIDKNEEEEFETSIYELLPSGDVFKYQCYSIGSKNQSIKTYLEKYLKKFKETTTENLILNAIKALGTTIREGETTILNEENVEISVLTKEGLSFLTKEELKEYFTKVNEFNPDNLIDYD